jgi:hypothetical protein
MSHPGQLPPHHAPGFVDPAILGTGMSYDIIRNQHVDERSPWTAAPSAYRPFGVPMQAPNGPMNYMNQNVINPPPGSHFLFSSNGQLPQPNGQAITKTPSKETVTKTSVTTATTTTTMTTTMTTTKKPTTVTPPPGIDVGESKKSKKHRSKESKDEDFDSELVNNLLSTPPPGLTATHINVNWNLSTTNTFTVLQSEQGPSDSTDNAANDKDEEPKLDKTGKKKKKNKKDQKKEAELKAKEEAEKKKIVQPTKKV